MKPAPFPAHLFAIALYPVLFLYANNRQSLTLVDILRPLAVSLLLIGLLYLLLRWILKDTNRAAVLATLLWAVFSLYGHVYQALRGAPGVLSSIGRHSILGPLMLVVVVVIIAAVVRWRGRAAAVSSGLNLFLSIMLVLPLAQMGLDELKGGAARSTTTSGQQGEGLSLPPAESAGLPDVYYIVLDTYTRADVLQQEIGLDISPFLAALEQRGFAVSACARSNYDSTRVSLASSLNMDFIPNLDSRFTPDNPNNGLLDNYILHSKVRATLEEQGYTTTAFATGFNFTEMTDADVYLSPVKPSLLEPDVRPFEALWLKTTALRLLFDTRPAFLSVPLNWLGFPHTEHVERQLFLLDQLPKLAQKPGPKFVFAHVIIPHVPLVFRADGSITRDDSYFRETFDQPVSDEYLIDGYRNQVEYLNARLLPIIDTILAESDQPPVIILQGDHGLLYFDHHPILNAMIFPGIDTSLIREAWTPVNTFRVFFNEYFGADLPLLPNESFASSYTRPYDFEAVPPEVCPTP